ncbi:hypothetical protein EWF20_09940 [Sulfolobus sp. S-194]|uniref:hypothetical protein n=1 Tax=Sulfolobus sp. S-194 TaxID=2512240 RepID=UPI0014373596|nr:hypothetical protein [Sulfolobus sp. S-194]QIW24441.1 hypothetical protein EWF20_09940 [Sulfolobus sp. S-194]
MQSPTKALIVGIIAGILLISFVASLTFVYTATRDVNATVVGDASANIALIANDSAIGYSSTGNPFVSYNRAGDLQINFGNVATNAQEILKYVFDVENNLNQTVQVTITITTSSAPSGTQVYILTPQGPSTTYTFTLGAGAEQAISLELMTGNTQGNAYFQMTVTAEVPYSSSS